MAAQPVRELPEGPEWLYELKLDGYRALVIKDGDQISILSRNAKNLTRMYPSIVAAARRLKLAQVVMDGELVALDEHGRPSFQALQHRGEHPGHLIVFYAFDLLHLEGRDLTGESLESAEINCGPSFRTRAGSSSPNRCRAPFSPLSRR